MDIISFLAELLWPIVVLIIFFALQKTIKERLLYTKSLRYKDIEVIFQDTIDDLKKNSDNTSKQIELPEKEIEEAERLAEISPSAAILQSWKELETAILEKVIALKLVNPNQPRSPDVELAKLETSGALKPSSVRKIRELRNLRNIAAQSSNLKVMRDDVLDYIKLVKTIKAEIATINELPKIKLLFLTLLILEYNHLIDTGKYDKISINDVHENIRQKNILNYISKITKKDSDFSIFENSNYSAYVEHYNEQLLSIYEGYAGNERRKWGVENKGLCLLVAWTNEILQKGSGWYPDD